MHISLKTPTSFGPIHQSVKYNCTVLVHPSLIYWCLYSFVFETVSGCHLGAETLSSFKTLRTLCSPTQWRTQEFFREGGGGVLRSDFFSGWIQQIQLRTEGRENGDLGSVAP
jgi:hypothetical protein